MTRNIDDWIFKVKYQGEVLKFTNILHQPKIIRTTVVQGGADMVGGEPRSCQRDGICRTASGENESVKSVESLEIAIGAQESRP